MTCRRHIESGRIGEKEMRVKYAALFEQAEANWAAYVPDLPGCMTTGKTPEEPEINIREAIEGHLRTLRDFGDPVPQPTSVAKELRYHRRHSPH
jgi:predicted RNase H-like HicB family nuclease